MSSNSLILIPQTTYSGGGLSQTLVGDKVKGDGFYGRSDGLHTIQTNIAGFTGDITLQGSLEIDPGSDDWFTITLETSNLFLLGSVDTTGAITQTASAESSILNFDNSTTNSTYNFIGNYVWVRAQISNWTAGIVNSIYMNN